MVLLFPTMFTDQCSPGKKYFIQAMQSSSSFGGLCNSFFSSSNLDLQVTQVSCECKNMFFDLILKNIIDTVLNPKYQHISFLSNTCNPIHLGARRRNRALYWRIVWDATKALRWPLWRTWGAMLRTITPNARKPSRVSWIASMCSRPRENGEYSKTHI